MLLSGGWGQVGVRVVSNHPKTCHCLFPGFMGVQWNVTWGYLWQSAADAPYLWSCLLSRWLMPHTVGSALQWQRRGGSIVLDHKRPFIMMLPDVFICFGISGNPSPSQVSLFSYTELTVLWGMTEGWHQVTTFDLIRAPGVSALFCFIFPPAAISFERVDDFYLFPRVQWIIFDLPAPNQCF